MAEISMPGTGRGWLVAAGLALLVGEAAAGEVPAGPAAQLAALVAAYPDHLAAIEGNELVWKDGTRMTIEDGRAAKTFEERLNEPDIADQFYAPYAPGPPAGPPAIDSDPGRVRYEPLFAKMYGDCRQGGVSGDLVPVRWLPKHGGGTVMLTRINGAAAHLQAISDELDALPDRFMAYLKPSAGTYNCRVIAGTRRSSMHAYGAAIDINTAKAHYWRNAKPDSEGHYAYRNAIPFEIVEIFERHGFIWGGKWYHYDTMHFEYRPELVSQPAKAVP